MDGQLHTNITLKPLRFAFLVPATDRQAMLDAIETCTLLWGGVWNPIVPIYKRSPQWTSRPHQPRPTTEQWLAGHLEFFEPDVVVLAAGVDKPTGYGREDLITLKELHESALRGEPRYGLSVHHLYQELFRKRFRFVEHGDPPPFVFPGPTRRTLHSAVTFGRLRPEEDNHIDERNFADLFRAQPSSVDCDGLESRLRDHAITPLGLTGVEVPRWFGGQPAILVYDHRKTSDLLALWNLRACVDVVAAIPHAWIGRLGPLLKAIVESLNKEPDERGMYGSWPCVVTAPSVSTQDVHAAIEALKPELGKNRIRYDAYPELWDHRSGWIRFYGTLRREVDSRFDTLQIDEEGHARVPLLRPDFIDEDALAWSESWANCVSFSTRWGGDDSTIVFPPDATDVGALVSRMHSEAVRRVRAGISYACSSYSTDTHLDVPSGTKLICWWLQQRGWSASESGAGRLASQLLRVARGPRGVAHYCSRPILKAITTMQSPERNGLASKTELLEWLESDDEMDRAFGHTADRRLERLIDRGILRVGLRVQCSVCGQRGWHALGDLDQTLSCPACLACFPFPESSPPENEWMYRAYGPYSLPDHARGSFSVALAVGFFFRLRHLQCAYALGLDIRRHTGSDEEHLEIDATIVAQRDGSPSAGRVVLCECKSLGPFAQVDIDRARSLERAFPDAILAFVTLRDQLGNQEKRRFVRLLRDLPDVYTEHHQVHRPLLILTATELHHRLSLKQSWERAEGRVGAFGKSGAAGGWHGDLLELCTITQHLYLSDSDASQHHSTSVGTLIGRPGYGGTDTTDRRKKKNTKKKASKNRSVRREV